MGSSSLREAWSMEVGGVYRLLFFCHGIFDRGGQSFTLLFFCQQG
jgi:hypothetical protein